MNDKPRIDGRPGLGPIKSTLKLSRVGVPHVLLALIIVAMLTNGCSGGAENTNANTNASANRPPMPTQSQGAQTTNSARRAPLREEYERDKTHYEREAKESGRKIGTGFNDGWLWVKTRSDLAHADDLGDSQIDVDVDNGVITLSGTVANLGQKARAVGIAKKTEGVQRIDDRLTVANASPTPATQSEFDIDREVQKLREGAAVTEVPVSMEVSETRTVILVLSPEVTKAKETEEELKHQLSNEAAQMPKRKIESKTRFESERVKFSRFMEAKLSGQGFEIKNVTPERQPVSNNQQTDWRWDVKALSPGDQYLYVTLNAIFAGDGTGEKTRSVNTFSKVVKVKVSWGTRIGTFISTRLRDTSVANLCQGD
jgi:hypothetical protein